MRTPDHDHDASVPVILYGALRSGTTIFRLILDHHPALSNPGETDFLLDHLVRDPVAGWRYDRAALADDRVFLAQGLPLPEADGPDLLEAVTYSLGAKQPGSRLVLVFHRNAAKLAQLFPEAKIIHLLRDPRDVARSSIGMGWAGNSYYGVDHWIATEAGWDAADIPAENVITVRFETLMADLEAELTRICTFLDLPFDPAMLRYHETSTYAPPDPGIAQKWRQKAGSREIARIEGRVGSLLEARGYKASGAPVMPRWPERAALAVENRLKRWRFNADRYGWGLFLGQHAARVLGLKKLAGRLAARQEAIRIGNLQ